MRIAFLQTIIHAAVLHRSRHEESLIVLLQFKFFLFYELNFRVIRMATSYEVFNCPRASVVINGAFQLILDSIMYMCVCVCVCIFE